MKMTPKDIIGPATRVLLMVNGASDRSAGTSMYDGWREIAKECGFSEGRTPAREAYEDGWYGVPLPPSEER